MLFDNSMRLQESAYHFESYLQLRAVHELSVICHLRSSGTLTTMQLIRHSLTPRHPTSIPPLELRIAPLPPSCRSPIP